jgi:hypothetical protein
MVSMDSNGQSIHWDVGTGTRLADGDSSEFPFSNGNGRSPDGRWLAVPWGNTVLLVDLSFKKTPQERLRRELQARPKPRWHKEQLLAAQSAGNHFQAMFHAAWLLKISPSDAWSYDDLQGNYREMLTSNNGQTPQLPVVASDMLQLPRGAEQPQLNEESAMALNQQIWELIKVPAADGNSAVSAWHLQRMQDVCKHFPKGYYFNTLGVLQYRLGQYEPAIVSLRKSLEQSPAESRVPGPSPVDLAFLALCKHRLGQADQAAELRSQMLTSASQHPESVLNPDLQSILLEVQATFDGPESVSPAASLEDFQRESTFEGLTQHRWRFPATTVASSFTVSSNNSHSGKTCLQAQGSYGPVMAQQTVAVIPNSKYRLTGWIRTELEVPAIEATAPGAPLVGASFAIVDREETSEVITGTSDWKQVTWDFSTGDANSITLGCRLGLAVGTAWFDDLKLDKVN